MKRTTKRADAKQDGIRILEAALKMSRQNLCGATGSERERIWSEIQGMEARLAELMG